MERTFKKQRRVKEGRNFYRSCIRLGVEDSGEAPGIRAALMRSSGLLRLVCEIYETGRVPEDCFRDNIIIAIPKKNVAEGCVRQRTITLVYHTCKILT